MPGTANFTQYGGDTFSKVIKFYLNDGTTPVVVTDWVFAMDWKPIGFTNKTVASISLTSAASGGITIDAVSGNNQITITTLSLVKGGGGTVTTTVSYIAVCTSNTITISAVTSAGGNAVDTTDTSVVNYFVIN